MTSAEVDEKKLKKKASAAIYYLKNKEKVKAAARAYELANPEKVRAKKAVWRSKNTLEIRVKHKAYREANADRNRMVQRAWDERNLVKSRAIKKGWADANRETLKVKSREWSRLNAGRRAAYCANRRRRMRVVPWTSKQEVTQFYIEASKLTRETGVPHEVDHIYPIDSPYVSGLHVQGNLRVVSRTVNRVKSTKLPGHLADELWDPSALEVFHG